MGYIIREESVLKGQNYKNGMVKIKTEGERVEKGGTVFRYYTKGENELIKKIEELDIKIDEALKKQDTFPTSDIKLLEAKIDLNLNKIYQKNAISQVNEIKKEIEESITKKAQIAGEQSPAGSYVKKLINERAEYENKLNSGTEKVTTNISGIVSYKIDGLEEVLNPDDFSNVTSELLSELNLKTGQIIEDNSESGKIINNFNFYIAVIMDSEKSKEAKVGDEVNLRIAASNEIEVEISHIVEEDEKRVIIFKTSNYIPELISYRKASVEVIWWSYEGLKVPNSAITMKDDLAYVTRNRAGYLDEILVKVLRQNENYSIVRKYKTEELRELGYTDKEIINMKNIAIYDEIVLKK